jgi:hypothetical protein
MSIRLQLLYLAEIAGKPATPATIVAVPKATKEILFARFFFSRAVGKDWVPQAVAEISAGGTEEAAWVRLKYLLRVLQDSPPELADTLTKLRPHLHDRLRYDAIHALLEQSPDFAWQMRFLVVDYLAQPQQFIVSELGSYLAHVARAEKVEPTELCRLIASIVVFMPDPKQAEKTQAKDADADVGFLNRLEPEPRFESWEFREILEKGVRPAAEKFPLPVAITLVVAVRDLLHLKFTSPNERDGALYDASEIWCNDLGDVSSVHADPDGLLVHTLCFACQKVYGTDAKPGGDLCRLDQLLREEPWEVFERLRYYLYSLFPTAARQWVVTEATSFAGYGEDSYGVEFATMLRKSAEAFGEEFLSKAERETIFKQIIAGPPKAGLNEVWGEEIVAREFQNHQQRFWAKQLWPFEPVLFGEYLAAYKSSAPKDEPITAAAYSPYSSGEIHSVQTRSPKTPEELGAMTDDELVAFLNTWPSPGRTGKEWWIEVTVEGLATAFRQLVRTSPARFAAYGLRWQAVARPVFLRYAIDAAKDEVKGGELSRLPAWLALCDWVTQHGDAPGEETDDRSDEWSRWEGTRREVVDFVAVCLVADSKVPLDYRAPLAALLEKLTTGADRWLDRGKPLVKPEDPLTDAINTTRGRAIETFAQFGLWVRRAAGEAGEPLREAKAAFERRFAGHPALVPAEHAQLGRLYPYFLYLDEAWAAKSTGGIFGKPGSIAWQAGFGTFVVFSEPSRQILGHLHEHYDYALAHPDLWPEKGPTRRDFLPRLGQHLFLFYLWGEDDLKQPDGFLNRYYQVTKPKAWTSLLQHIGHSLKRTQELSPELRTRCMEYFAARLAVANVEELGGFTFWVEADCLDLKWRLQSLGAVLSLPGQSDRLTTLVVRSLSKYLTEAPELVVAALAKLVAGSAAGGRAYFEAKEVAAILKVGLTSKDAETCRLAGVAQENLLQAGLFEYLTIGD